MKLDSRGRLKLFFSYAEGSGKTRAMLQSAHAAKAQGIHLLVGYIAPHNTKETLAVMEGLPQLPPVMVDGKAEFDLDGALSRKPDLIVVDEMAHTNGRNCRHRKRYQDIDELLKAGIDVYTTVNVSNIESLRDTVAAITGIAAWERIPDSVFDKADQVELIDIEPEELMDRLREQGISCSQITIAHLTALREIALRRCADRVKRLSDRLQQVGSFHTDEHILACLSPAPSNAKIIRTAARMAHAFNGQFTALFVETPDFAEVSAEDRKRLQDNQKLAEELGANIEMVYGEDVPYQIAEFARLSGITKIVLGRSDITRKHRLGKAPLTEQLLSYASEVDIHIIPDQNAGPVYRGKKTKRPNKLDILCNSAKSAGILACATMLGFLIDGLGFTEANIIMVYILGVLVTSITTSHRVYSLVSSVASVFIFNFFFTSPRSSLMTYGTGYPITFLIMFLTAYITGTLASSYKEQAGQSAKIARRTKILFDTDQLLSKVKNKDEIINATAKQIGKLLERNIVIFENVEGVLSRPHLFPTNGSSKSCYDWEREQKTVQWVLKNNHAAGATTDTLSDARYLYLALRVNECVYGVVGIEAENAPLDASEYGILLSILGECALALENEKNAREKEAAAILAESEQLRANLLRTISHDLRTPLTTISGNASNLLSNGASFDEETKHQLYSDIYDDSMWLINLVENLLSATRIEEGRMTLRASAELLDDIVEEAVHHIDRKGKTHQISTVSDGEFLFVKADARLMVQVIVNIIDNAVKYTSPGSSIVIATAKKGNMASVRISDTGKGISDQDKEKIFDKFYCGSSKIADNRRSLGLGLYLCKAIVEAHGGTIAVSDNQPHGSVFEFTLPLEEVTLHE